MDNVLFRIASPGFPTGLFSRLKKVYLLEEGLVHPSRRCSRHAGFEFRRSCGEFDPGNSDSLDPADDSDGLQHDRHLSNLGSYG